MTASQRATGHLDAGAEPSARVAAVRTRRLTEQVPVAPLALGLLGAGLLAVGNGVAGLVVVVLATVGVVAIALGPRVRERIRIDDVLAPPEERPDDRSARIEQDRLVDALADPSQLQAVVRPPVVTAVTARLARRGTTLAAPGTRELLGEPLWTFVTGPPPSRRLPLTELDDLLTRVEAL